MRYDSNDVSKSDRKTEGQLSENPLAELIREAIDADLSGAIRVSKGPAKAVVYFEKGSLRFATSNLRAHRLREVVKRDPTIEKQLAEFPSSLSDEELAAVLLEQRALPAEALQQLRTAQASDVLRTALLWTEGEWSFDRRVRVANDLKVSIDIDRLLLESARHLPLRFIRSRVGPSATYSVIKAADANGLSKSEAFIFSRVAQAGMEVVSGELACKGLRQEDSARAIYALCVAGFLSLAQAPNILSDKQRTSRSIEPVRVPTVSSAQAEADVSTLFNRLNSAKTHYEVLDVAPTANPTEIKNAYHDLARRFHPDRFHQSDLRAGIESAFARIGRAYETLNDDERRSAYDKSLVAKRGLKPMTVPTESPPDVTKNQKTADPQRAETAFQLGTQALQGNQNESAIRYFAEAAMLEPRVARYRAYYGSALSRNPNSRRTAESELKAALKIEPNNASFHVMLAELYQQIGLRKRAESEALRALSADPANKSARALLSKLTVK